MLYYRMKTDYTDEKKLEAAYDLYTTNRVMHMTHINTIPATRHYNTVTAVMVQGEFLMCSA